MLGRVCSVTTPVPHLHGLPFPLKIANVREKKEIRSRSPTGWVAVVFICVPTFNRVPALFFLERPLPSVTACSFLCTPSSLQTAFCSVLVPSVHLPGTQLSLFFRNSLQLHESC